MTALVGPVPSIRFHDGSAVGYDQPKSTMDPRWKACADHRPACDCREAELAEYISNLIEHLDAVKDAARAVLKGHPVWAYEEGANGEREVGCMCTGCQIVRASRLLPYYEASRFARDDSTGFAA